MISSSVWRQREAHDGRGRYSPATCTGSRDQTITGNPDAAHISTSYVERQNLTMRMSIRRFTRLTNAFSKKVDNHKAAQALYFMHYNFGRIHKTLRVTPAMEAGISDHVWSLEEIAGSPSSRAACAFARCYDQAPMMTRRRFLQTVSVSVLAAPLTAEAQQARVYRIGVILQGGPYYAAIDGLRDGLRELGLEEGKQFLLHVRDTKGDLTSVEAAARSLEEQKVDLIYTLATSVTLAAKRATKSVSIVFYAGTDPVTVGLVESFRKPGGRLTGIHGQFTDLTAKRLELLKEMMPGLHRVLTFYSPDNPATRQSLKIARDAARHLKLELVERPVASVEALRAGLRALRPGEAEALFLVADAMVVSQEEVIIDAARAKRLPTMLSYKVNVAKGALASYGENYYVLGRLSAKHVQRILLGANPGDLPVEQLDKLYFVINLKTAKTLGLTIPQSVLVRADEVIQ
jgi:putative tryptophan/tyrosine transport system substrate-binding protein